MTVHPTLQRLTKSDPAQGPDPSPTDELLADIKARHVHIPESIGRRTFRLRLAVVPAAVAAFAVALVLLLAAGPSSTVDLAAAAYARTTTPPGRIGYSLVTIEVTTRRRGAVVSREQIREESWNRGRQAHWVQTFTRNDGSKLITDHVVDSRGVMRMTTEAGLVRIVRASDNADSAQVIAREQEGFVAEFRRAYEGGSLDPAGDLTFAGRPARRYIVNSRRTQGPGQAPQTFYIDRETERPLGRTSSLQYSVGNSNAILVSDYVLTVRRIAQLPATAANIRDLETSSVPRRRDSRGCIRSAVRNTRAADSVKRYDCTGKPGAVIPTP